MDIKMENDIPGNTVIWRYIDLSKLLDLLITKELHFTRADKFKDPSDCSVAELFHHYLLKVNGGTKSPDFDKRMDQIRNDEKSIKKKIYLNCWHKNEGQSAALWKIYMKSDEGVALKSTVKNLRDSLSKAFAKVGFCGYRG